MKLAGQLSQLRKLLDQLDQGVGNGVKINVIDGAEQKFRDELVALINNNKPGPMDSDSRMGGAGKKLRLWRQVWTGAAIFSLK